VSITPVCGQQVQDVLFHHAAEHAASQLDD
jgi:hypothetical protein